MTFPNDPHERFPKGDHNRRLALGMNLEDFAAHAGVSPEELHKYEFTEPDGPFDLVVAQRVGNTLERLEASHRPLVDEGPVPADPNLAKDESLSAPIITAIYRTPGV
ncbi:MAG: hypothetical protein JWR75_1433 [Devosia sp.]|nr:hypothetical protein [Devosia sp.]